MSNINTCYFCSSPLINTYGIFCCQNEHPRLRISTNRWVSISLANKFSDLSDPSFPLIIWTAPNMSLKTIHIKDGSYSYLMSNRLDEINISEGKFNFEQLKNVYHKIMKMQVFL